MLPGRLGVALAPQYGYNEMQQLFRDYYQYISPHCDGPEAIERLILSVSWMRLTNVFLLDAEGQRFCYGKAMEYSPALQRFNEGFDLYKHKKLGRLPQLLEYLKLPVNIVDQERPEDVQQHLILRHPSEAGWNLLATNKRHFLKLPQEIRDLIVEYALCIKTPRTIRPLTNIPYLESKRTLSFVEVFPDPGDSFLSMAFFRREDQYGAYTEVCPIRRQSIDATCLRVNKTFLKNWKELLYSKNTFDFGMVKAFRPWKYHQNGILMYQNRPKKPDMSTAHVVIHHIELVMNRVPESHLTEWILEDPFVRFLHCIGPENAALVKSLYFHGVAKSHDCPIRPTSLHNNCYTVCRHDLVNTLRCYVPFIRALCLNLRCLTIKVSLDSVTLKRSVTELELATERAMQQFLRVDVRTITTLVELVVIDDSNSDYKWAQETIEIVKERAACRIKRELAERKLRKEAEAKAEAIRALDFRCLDYVGMSNTAGEA